MGKGKRKREREERRQGKGRLADEARVRKEQREREEIGRSAIENSKARGGLQVLAGGGEPDAPKSDPAPLEDLPEFQAHIQAWREAGCPPGPGK